MGGGYIECGVFFGGDKSGSPIEAVFRALEVRLPFHEREFWRKELVEGVQYASSEEEFKISPQIVQILLPPLRSYHSDLGIELGFPEPSEAPEIDVRNGLNPTEAKWGTGKGWCYYCACDLLQACEVSLRTGEDIIIHFD